MAFSFFENALAANVNPLPDEMYRNQQQEFINMMWDNTTAVVTMKEQSAIGSNEYNDIEVWIDSTVSDTTTGLKDTRDFNKIVYKDITHSVKRGLMYVFDNNYWLVHAYTEYNGVVQSSGIRRCNNMLKMIDPKNGSVFSIPCCVDYDMSAPSLQVSRYINTSNNHAVVMVQGNDDTIRLFKTNTRFLLSGRPFKLLGYQNAVTYDLTNDIDTLLYLDLFLDEIHAGDNLETGIADNSTVIENQPIVTGGHIVLSPYFDKIRQYETKEFSVVVSDVEETPINVDIQADSDVITITHLTGNNYKMYCSGISKTPIVLQVSAEVNGQQFNEAISIEAVSMMG